MPVLLAALFGLVAFLALVPLSLIQRYRAGTARRLARGWISTLNLIFIGASAGLFLVAAAVTNAWVPQAFTYAGAGLVGGVLLGVFGLGSSRWEESPHGLYYTPNRWLVLAITLAVTARVIYGIWRGWQASRAALEGAAWLAASGVAGSLAVGGVVLGYYVAYWAGVRRRLNQHRRANAFSAPRQRR